MSKRNTKKPKQKTNTLQYSRITDTSVTETSSTVELDKNDPACNVVSFGRLWFTSYATLQRCTLSLHQVIRFIGKILVKLISPFLFFWHSLDDEDTSGDYFEEVDKELCLDMKKIQLMDLVACEDSASEPARKVFSSEKKKYKEMATPEEIETPITGPFENKDKATKDNINKLGDKGLVSGEKILDPQSKGAIPKAATNSAKAKMPHESGESTAIPAGMKNGGNRVPYISDPNGPIGKKAETIPLRTIFTEEKSFDDEDKPMTDDYKLFCIQEFKYPEKGFVTVEPGVFSLALAIPYEDDFKLIKTVYPTIQYDSTMCQVEGNVYLLEKKVFQHLDNFHTELLCSIFDALSKQKNANGGYITEFDYLILMKQKFNYSLLSIYGDLENYSAKETKSKFCPGRNSKIEKLFQKQTFK